MVGWIFAQYDVVHRKVEQGAQVFEIGVLLLTEFPIFETVGQVSMVEVLALAEVLLAKVDTEVLANLLDGLDAHGADTLRARQEVLDRLARGHSP